MTRLFLGFAFAYFLSALLRAVTATLAPTFQHELGLGAGDLGLLAGAYFLGFAAMQLPLGQALDRFGPRRVLLSLLSLAVTGCAAFAAAQGLATLLAARMLIGMGVAACLMAPLTSFRHHFSPAAQLRANSWMLMTGSLGMVASTLPVQALLPLLGWRGLFVLLAVLLALAMLLIVRLVPADAAAAVAPADADGGYRHVVRHPLFQRLAPLAFVQYGGLIAIQALWAGPWLTQVAGWTPQQAAGGLFGVNLAMLLTFLAWGSLMPQLSRRGIGALQVLRRGQPLVLVLLAVNVVAGPRAGAWSAVGWGAWCVASTCLTLSQPAIGQAFPSAVAGRALSAYNLVIFAGVFSVQWGIGLAIDALRAAGWAEVAAFQAAFGAFGVLCAAASGWFAWRGRA
jgi:predicted MFS family arabinose efflux permease